MTKTKALFFAAFEVLAAALAVHIVVQSPIRERLECKKSGVSAGVACVRTIKYVFRDKQYSYEIPDAGSVKLDEMTDARADYITVNFFISGTAGSDEKVVLLAVPEKNTGYASELAQKISSLPAGADSEVSFQRSDLKQTSLLFLLVVVFGAVVACAFLRPAQP